VAKVYSGDIEGAKKDYELVMKAEPAYAIAYNNYALIIAENAPDWLRRSKDRAVGKL